MKPLPSSWPYVPTPPARARKRTSPASPPPVYQRSNTSNAATRADWIALARSVAATLSVLKGKPYEVRS